MDRKEKIKMKSQAHPSFVAAKPLVGKLRTAIRRVITANPGLDTQEVADRMFAAFVRDGTLGDDQWAEALVFSLVMAETEEMWLKAEVV